jgi:putative salt-induced outer membrane protein
VKIPSLLVLVLWVATRGAALAQQPPCPCPTPPPLPPSLWAGSAELSFLSTSGNTSTSSLGGGLEVNYKPAPWTLIFKAAYLRASTDSVTTAEQFNASLKGIRDLTPRLDVFAGAGYLRNRFAGFDSLINGEAGVGYKLLLGPVHTLRGELGFGYTHEDQLIGDNRSYASARASLGYKWQISKTAAFTNDLSYSYDLSDSKNWILSDKAAVTATLTSILSLKASYTLLYNHEPVPTFKRTDTATAVALVAKL